MGVSIKYKFCYITRIRNYDFFMVSFFIFLDFNTTNQGTSFYVQFRNLHINLVFHILLNLTKFVT